jgi:hypothetical protein
MHCQIKKPKTKNMTPKDLHKAIQGWTFENFGDVDYWGVADGLLAEAIKLIPKDHIPKFEEICRDHLSLDKDEKLEDGCKFA